MSTISGGKWQATLGTFGALFQTLGGFLAEAAGGPWSPSPAPNPWRRGGRSRARRAPRPPPPGGGGWGGASEGPLSGPPPSPGSRWSGGCPVLGKGSTKPGPPEEAPASAAFLMPVGAGRRFPRGAWWWMGRWWSRPWRLVWG